MHHKNINGCSNDSCRKGGVYACECVSQRCDDKENWCYCISQKQEVEGYKCDGAACTCKKAEEKKVEETPKQAEETTKKKSWYKRVLNIFK